MTKIEKAVEYLKDYINTYENQTGYKDYSDRTFIADILYGLGASLDDEYQNADGFRKFKEEVLAPYVNEQR